MSNFYSNRNILFFLVIFTSQFSTAQESTFKTSDGVELYLNAKGTGMPCLYIHNGPGTAGDGIEQFSSEMLERHFQMIYLDVRGVGKSSRPIDNNYSMERMIADCEEIRNHLGIKKWLVMGHSFSGTILMGYALRSQKSLKGMLMFNCTLDVVESLGTSWIPKACDLLGVTDLEYFNDHLIPLDNKVDSLLLLLKDNALAWQLSFATKVEEDMQKETYHAFPQLNNDFTKAALKLPDYLVNFKIYSYKINIPVLFFYGQTDWTTGPDHHKGIDFPYMVKWPSDVGHMPFIENKEDVEAAIVAYLKRFKL